HSGAKRRIAATATPGLFWRCARFPRDAGAAARRPDIAAWRTTHHRGIRCYVPGSAGRAVRVRCQRQYRDRDRIVVMTNCAIDAASLGAMLDASARIGAANGGLRRLTLTPEDKAARDLLATWTREGNYALSVDQLGNMFVRREGTDPALPPVLIGSHL